MACRLPLLILITSLAISISACATFPELDAAVPADVARTRYPRIVPLDGLLAQAAVTQTGPLTQAALDVRAAALRSKAAALRATP